MRNRILAAILAMSLAAVSFSGCSSTAPAASEAPAAPAASTAPAAEPAKSGNDKLVVGVAQIGQESSWRDAETASIQWYQKHFP